MSAQLYRCPSCLLVYAYDRGPDRLVCSAVRCDLSHDDEPDHFYVCGEPLETFEQWRPVQPWDVIGPGPRPALDFSGFAAEVARAASGSVAGLYQPPRCPNPGCSGELLVAGTCPVCHETAESRGPWIVGVPNQRLQAVLLDVLAEVQRKLNHEPLKPTAEMTNYDWCVATAAQSVVQALWTRAAAADAR